MYRKQYHIFFVGIGGIGMSGIAELLLTLQDAAQGAARRELREAARREAAERAEAEREAEEAQRQG